MSKQQGSERGTWVTKSTNGRSLPSPFLEILAAVWLVPHSTRFHSRVVGFCVIVMAAAVYAVHVMCDTARCVAATSGCLCQR